MSVTKELIEKKRELVQSGQVRDLHLHQNEIFLLDYDRILFV